MGWRQDWCLIIRLSKYRGPPKLRDVDAPSGSVSFLSQSTFVRTEFNGEAIEHRVQPDDGNHAKDHSSQYVARIIQSDYKSAH